MSTAVKIAKDFLVAKLLEQAALDGMAISDIEKRMFLFSETSQVPPDYRANEKFEEDYDEEEYETKITQLLQRAFARDQQNKDTSELWKKHLVALKDADFYGLVMVDQAEISY
jgi:hypothetical protein